VDAHLIATLMSVLSVLLSRRQSIREGIDYLEQEVLGAILALVEKVEVSLSYCTLLVGLTDIGCWRYTKGSRRD
jgi:U3 small nucleolar RNA-associated protein 10